MTKTTKKSRSLFQRVTVFKIYPSNLINSLSNSSMNLLSSNAFRVDGNNETGFGLDIDSGNIVNGKPVNFSANCNNLLFNNTDFTSYGEVFFANCTNVTIINSNFSRDNKKSLLVKN